MLGVALAQSSRALLMNAPHLVYGTAWKKEETAYYVSEAVKAGFRCIDTACQPRHYNEAGVGIGWTAAAEELGLKRSDIWLQTKYTPIGGQDPNNVPYDPKSPVAEQIRTSLGVSLKNLKTEYLDSWVMHSPLNSIEETVAAWRVMEEAVDEGTVHQLGISNCYSLDNFRYLYQNARIKPKVGFDWAPYMTFNLHMSELCTLFFDLSEIRRFYKIDSIPIRTLIPSFASFARKME